jgi:hypothetical protein
MTTPRMLMCHGYVGTGQVPVCNADGNVGAMQVTSPAQQERRCPRDESSDAGATPVKMTARCW